MRERLKRLTSLLTILFCTTLQAQPDLTALNSMTGNLHTRIVWLQGSGTTLFGGGNLVGFDSKENRIRPILPGEYNLYRPILCSGGLKVVMTINNKVYSVSWDGTGKKYLMDGFCSDVWVDPQTNTEWLIVSKPGETPESNYTGAARYRIDTTAISVSLVDIAQRQYGTYYAEWLQISGDGLMGFDCFPWPNAAMMLFAQPATDPTPSSTRLSQGCWPSMASDTSHVCCLFPSDSNGHVKFDVFKGLTRIGFVTINAGPVPAASPKQFYHPKFASKGGRFISITGGVGSSELNVENTAEVYLGKFNNAYNGFDSWVRVTSNSIPDYCADAWIGVESSTPSIQFSVSSLTFNAQQVGANPPAQSMVVSSPFGSLTGVTVKSDKSWLTLGSPIPDGNTFTIANNINTASLAGGLYTATVTVTAANAVPISKAYTVTLIVAGSPVATSISISPQQVQVVQNTFQQFTASVLDQTGKAMIPQPVVSWTTAGPGIGAVYGSISTAGLFSAGTNLGTYTITASSGTLSAQAHAVVISSAPITIFLPIPGTVYQVGTVMTIKWTAAATVAGIGIEVSPDMGKNWYLITSSSIPRTDPRWGAYNWTIPEFMPSTTGPVSLVSNQVLVHIWDYFNNTLQTKLNSPFTISKNIPVIWDIRKNIKNERFSVSSLGKRTVITAPSTGMVEFYDLTGAVVRLYMQDRNGTVLNTPVTNLFLVKYGNKVTGSVVPYVNMKR